MENLNIQEQVENNKKLKSQMKYTTVELKEVKVGGVNFLYESHKMVF